MIAGLSFAAEMIHSGTYWGTLTSLYEGLQKDEVGKLENVVQCRIFGHYEEAESIFTECLRVRWVPIVAVERATTYDRMGLEHRRAETLREILDSKMTTSTDLPKSLEYLCRLNLAESECKTKGKLLPALVEARRFRDWLIQFETPFYTDVLVSPC